MLQAWVRMFNGLWDGIVVVPRPGLGRAVIPTAWTCMLRQASLDPEAAATFIGVFRGHGPGRPVR